MQVRLDSVSASGLGGGSSQLAWNHTIQQNLGKKGLIIVSGFGREEGGQTNPEEIDHITFNGVTMTLVTDANKNETGVTQYELHGSNVPGPGTYEVRIFYKGTGTPDKSRGCCAVFRNLRNQNNLQWTRETYSGGTASRNLTPLTKNALLVCTYGWRVGFNYESVVGGFTEAITNRGDNSGGIAIWYKQVAVPVNTTISITCTNPEDHGMILTEFQSAANSGLVALA